MKKAMFLLGFFQITISTFAQYTDVINSNRPGKSIAAFSVGKTVIQAELGLYGVQEKHDPLRYEANGFGSELSVRYGAFLEQLEFTLDMQYQHDWYQAPLVEEIRSGMRQFTLGAKYLVYDPFLKLKDKKTNLYSWKANHKFNWRDFIPAVAVYGGININFGNNPFFPDDNSTFSPKGMLVLQNHFGNRWVWVNNIIVDRFLTNYSNFGLISTLTRGFNMRWSAFGELQGYKGNKYSDFLVRGGAAYLVRENMQLDASLTKNVKETPSLLYGSVGLSWRFDSNYEKVYYRVPNKEEKGKKDKKDKDKKGKKDKKKRKDEVEVEEVKP